MSEEENQINEFLYKVLVVGDIGTGKTSIIKRYVHNIFSEHYKSTIGVDFALKVINVDENTIVRLQLWDIAGQERFGNMTRVYYREAVAAFIVFDVTRLSTYEAITKWKADLDAKVFLPGNNNNIPVVLLANKSDLISDQLISDGGEIDKFCKENGIIGWFPTSAKYGTGIDDAANCLLTKIMENGSNNIIRQKVSAPLYLKQVPPKESNGCC